MVHQEAAIRPGVSQQREFTLEKKKQKNLTEHHEGTNSSRLHLGRQGACKGLQPGEALQALQRAEAALQPPIHLQRDADLWRGSSRH